MSTLREEVVDVSGETLTDRTVRHPHFVLRIGGEPIDVLHSLRSTDAAHAIDRLESLRHDRTTAVTQACAAIEAAVPLISDSSGQRDLIRVKRDLFNNRLLNTGVISSLRPLLDRTAFAHVERAAASINRFRTAESTISDAYDADIAVSSEALRCAAALPNMRAALIASSPTLVQTLEKFEEGSSLRRKDWTNLHLALAGFLTRSTLKTSPKSSLTFVALGKWDREGLASPAFALDQPIMARDVRVRHSVLERILRPLVNDADKLADLAPIAVNPTLRIDRDVAEWQRIAYSEDAGMETYGIVSTTNRLRLQAPLLDALADLAGREPATLGGVRQNLRRRFGTSEPAEIDRLVRRFLSLDLLVMNDIWPAQRDRQEWAFSLAGWTIPSIADELARGIERLEGVRQTMVAQGPGREAQHAMEREIDGLAAVTGTPLRAATLRPVFYEDCTIVTPTISLREEAISALSDDFTDLLRLLPLLRGYGWAAAWLTRRFVEAFGIGGRCYDPASFLGGTAEALTAANGGSEATPPWQTGTVPDDADARAQDAVSIRFAAALRDHNGDADTWSVPAPLVAHFYEALPPSYRRRARSHCINGQFVSTIGDAFFVLNSVYPGNGRMTSRFLTSGDATASYIRGIAPGVPVAIPGVFGFNANVHPPLSDHEFAIPPYAPDFAETHKYPLGTCVLRHDPGLNRLLIDDSDGERLSPFYFGILNSWALPPVHRVLDWLNGASDLPFAIPDAIFSRDRPSEAPAVWVRPRLEMGGIVLGRRSWSVARTALPDPALEDIVFFRTLRDAWRALDLPRRLFFQASNFWRPGGGQGSRPNKTRKPMYLDIDNVWLVKVFQRALRSIPGHLAFTELLPEPGDTPVRVDGRARSAEITIEFGLSEADV